MSASKASITRLPVEIRPAAFDFQLDRSGQGPRQFLGEFEGILQTDGYAGYGKVGGKEMVHAACWAHYLESVFIWSEGRGSRLGPLGLAAVVSR